MNERVTKTQLAEMDRALATVGGAFTLAAKLLDVAPERFRGLVRYHGCLARWRHPRRGRPPGKAGLAVQPFADTAREGGSRPVDLVKAIVQRLTALERAELREWLMPRDGSATRPRLRRDRG